MQVGQREVEAHGPEQAAGLVQAPGLGDFGPEALQVRRQALAQHGVVLEQEHFAPGGEREGLRRTSTG